jgi:hypothetical protein
MRMEKSIVLVSILPDMALIGCSSMMGMRWWNAEIGRSSVRRWSNSGRKDI